MHSFVDNLGRTWAVMVNVATLKKIHGYLGVNIAKLLESDPKKFDEIIGDPIALVNVLYLLCQDQASSLGVTDEDFGKAFYGDVLGAATNALLEEIIDFFQDARQRAGLRKALAISRDAQAKMLDQMEKNLAALTADKLIEASLTAKQSV